METTQQQQPTTGLEYQIKLLALECIHYRNTGKGAQHLLNAAFRVVDQAAALTAAREALEKALQVMPDAASSVEYIRAALQQLNGEVQP